MLFDLLNTKKKQPQEETCTYICNFARFTVVCMSIYERRKIYLQGRKIYFRLFIFLLHMCMYSYQVNQLSHIHKKYLHVYLIYFGSLYGCNKPSRSSLDPCSKPNSAVDEQMTFYIFQNFPNLFLLFSENLCILSKFNDGVNNFPTRNF